MQIHSTVKTDLNVTIYTAMKLTICINRSVNRIGIMATVKNGDIILLCSEMPLNVNITDSKNHEIALSVAMEYITDNYGDHFDFQSMKTDQQFDHAITYIHEYDIIETSPLVEITFMKDATNKEIIMQTFDVNHAMSLVNERYKELVSNFYNQALSFQTAVYTNVKIGNDFVFMKCELIK